MTDPIITAAMEHQCTAAVLLARARAELHAALLALHGHPDYLRVEMGRRGPEVPRIETLTTAWVLEMSIGSILHDVSVDQAAAAIVADLDPEKSLRDLIETEAADLARFARARVEA